MAAFLWLTKAPHRATDGHLGSDQTIVWLDHSSSSVRPCRTGQELRGTASAASAARLLLPAANRNLSPKSARKAIAIS
jgi:hypothetical protein